jgi:hypothetical protein
MEALKAPPTFALRTERVDCPELGGAVVVRGLKASEAFAVEALRQQAMRPVREARREHDARRGAEAKARPPGTPDPPDDFEPPDLGFEHLQLYGRYVAHMLAATVQLENGLQVYSAAEWEVVGQHHPALITRLQRVAERLSGLDAEDVQKNSTPSPSSSSGSGSASTTASPPASSASC